MTTIKQFPPPIDSIEYANFILKGKEDEIIKRKNIQKKVELMLYKQYVNTLDGSEYKDEIKFIDRMIWMSECLKDRIDAKKIQAQLYNPPSLLPLSFCVCAGLGIIISKYTTLLF
jgi:hypothetical protein